MPDDDLEAEAEVGVPIQSAAPSAKTLISASPEPISQALPPAVVAAAQDNTVPVAAASTTTTVQIMSSSSVQQNNSNSSYGSSNINNNNNNNNVLDDKDHDKTGDENVSAAFYEIRYHIRITCVHF